jgi:hypothetical protein
VRGEGWRWRGAALALGKGPRIFFPERRRPNHRVKQAAPGNYPARCFAQRSVRIVYSSTERQTTRWAVRGSRLFKELCGHTRAEKNSARSAGCEPKRLPPVRSPALPYLMEHLRRGVAVDQQAVHKAGFQNSLSRSQFAASAAKQDHLMFS